MHCMRSVEGHPYVPSLAVSFPHPARFPALIHHSHCIVSLSPLSFPHPCPPLVYTTPTTSFPRPPSRFPIPIPPLSCVPLLAVSSLSLAHPPCCPIFHLPPVITDPPSTRQAGAHSGGGWSSVPIIHPPPPSPSL